MIWLLALFACDLSKYGAYTCDEYCGQVIGKTEECAEAAALAECEDAGIDSDCSVFTEEELAAYAAQGREDWAGASKEEMLASCQGDLASAGKTDAECQAETATLNNIECTDLLSLLGQIESSAR